MDPHRPISNSIVKRYSGENTKRGAFWEDNTMSKSFYILYNLSLLKMTSYAIVQASGKQFWVEENRFYAMDLICKMLLSMDETGASIYKRSLKKLSDLITYLVR